MREKISVKSKINDADSFLAIPGAVDRINVMPAQDLAVEFDNHPTCGVDSVGEEEHTF